MGVHPDFASAMESAKNMPQLHDHQAKGEVVGIPHVNADGKIDGMHYALVTPDWLNAKTTKDTKVYRMEPGKKPSIS